jgi:hypothetical protein
VVLAQGSGGSAACVASQPELQQEKDSKKMHKGHTSNAVKVTALQAGQSSRQQGQVLGTLYAKPFLMANNSVP